MIELKTVTKATPCRHCGKPDWCYRLSNGLEVCNREQVAEGWRTTKKRDRNSKTLLAKIEDSPQEARQVSMQRWDYPARTGEPLARMVRRNFSNGKKKCHQEGRKGNRWVKSLDHIDRADIPIYRYGVICEAIQAGEMIFFAEGETCADALVAMGLQATCNIGGSGNLADSDLDDLDRANLIILPDCDRGGIKWAEKIHARFPQAQAIYADPDHYSWKPENIPPDNGYDIANWIEDQDLTTDQILAAIEPYREGLLKVEIPDFAPEAEQHYTEKAIEALYSDKKYIAIGETLYRFNGKHYAPLGTKSEQRRIADWCRTNPVATGADRWKYSWATAATINNIWAWLLIRFGVEPEDINPPGLNLNNGTLILKFKGKDVTWELTKHSPDRLYTYCVDVDYDPQADDFNCNRLLSCLDPQQQVIFLRSIAGGIDLSYIRGKQGRAVKALLLHGEGSNGKDSLRTVTQLLFGNSMVSLSVSDFQQYDSGRKFPVAKLEGAKISWSSENSRYATLETVESLKFAVTGEPIDIEHKNKPQYEIEPKAVFFFNCNEPPRLTGGSEAIDQRYALLKFEKTFKKGADPRNNEIEADPRFRYDPEFLAKEVAPAFLNKVLEQLPKLLKEGIDYSSIAQALKELREDSNHLWQFCKELGINYLPGEKIYIKDLWEDLKHWYTKNGTLEVFSDGNGKEKLQWYDQVNPYDKTIKSPNQVFSRFSQLFPKIKKMSETIDRKRLGQSYISGIGYIASLASHPHEQRATASQLPHKSEAVSEATTQLYRECEASEAISLQLVSDEKLLCEVIRRFPAYPLGMQQKFIEDLVNASVSSEKSEKYEKVNASQTKYVRYKDETWKVLYNYRGIYSLGKSGFSKVFLKVHCSECTPIE
jgi:putative DNA primase/helicase